MVHPGGHAAAVDPPGHLVAALKLALAAGAAALACFACYLHAIPHFKGGVPHYTNDAAAIAALERIAAAEATFHAAVRRDADGDGAGEYGDLAALAAATALPPELGATEPFPDGSRVVRHRGFFFLLRVPAAADAAEAGFSCYAWPIVQNNSGKRTLYVDERGVVFWRRYQAPGHGEVAPAVDAALPCAHAAAAPGDPLAYRGRDGGFWRPIR